MSEGSEGGYDRESNKNEDYFQNQNDSSNYESFNDDSGGGMNQGNNPPPFRGRGAWRYVSCQ